MFRTPNTFSKIKKTEHTKNQTNHYANNLLRATQIELPNINNISLGEEIDQVTNTSNIYSIKLKKTSKPLNNIFETRSPTSSSILSDQQINQEQGNAYESSSLSSSSHLQLTTYESIGCGTSTAEEPNFVNGSSVISLERYVSNFRNITL